MPVKPKKEVKTPNKSEEVDPATASENKESALKLIDILKGKIPTVQSPVRRVELSDLFVDIKCRCELEDTGTTDRLNQLDAEVDAELVDPKIADLPPPSQDDLSLSESVKTSSDPDPEDSELSYCTLEDLCQPSADDKRPHVITSRNGKNMCVEQAHIDQAAAGNTVNYSTLLKSAHKFINDNCFDGTAAFEPQFE